MIKTIQGLSEKQQFKGTENKIVNINSKTVK